MDDELEVKEATAGPPTPFDRNEDPLSQNQHYDNPANNVAPYAGPTDPTMTTVGPYQGDPTEVNPTQDYDHTYAPPGYEGLYSQQDDPSPNAFTGPYPYDSSASKAAGVLVRSYQEWENQSGWFDGTADSIYSRIIEADTFRQRAAAAGDAHLLDALDQEIETLHVVASEYEDSALREYVTSLPGGTVALENNGIGEDDGSWLYAEAKKVLNEVESYDWNAFRSEAPRMWVEARLEENPGLLEHELDTRQAAIDYVRDKTVFVTDPIKRAGLINDFVVTAERYRRSARQFTEANHRTAAATQKEAEYEQHQADLRIAYEDFEEGFGPPASVALPPLLDGHGNLSIGEDDGSYLYSEAKAILSEAQERDWNTWTASEAELWTGGRPVEMLRHANITSRAARDHAWNKTAGLFDVERRDEVMRQFLSAVEQRRAELLQEAGERQPEPVDNSDFDQTQRILDSYHLW